MIQNKVLVRAGRFQGGKLPYVNYVGQINPADMSKIIWWGDFGNDATGDGSISAPFLTFGAALDAFATNTHKWILKTDLSVYGEATAGQYVDDAADRVYIDPTKANDSGDGLTAATAKKTYAAAKAVLVSSGRTAIHCIGSFTMTDMITARTQGAIGDTLTYNVDPGIEAPSLRYTTTAYSGETVIAVAENSVGTLLVVSRTLSGSKIQRSTDGGATFSTISNPWSPTGDGALGVAFSSSVWVICGGNGHLLRSTDDGLTWSQITLANKWYGILYTGTQFIMHGKKTSAVIDSVVMAKSTDGSSWTAVTSAWGTSASDNVGDFAHDGSGNLIMVGYNGTSTLIQKSTDHGSTWTDISSTLSNGAGRSVAIGSGVWTVFAGDSVCKAFKSTDFGATWSEITGVVSGSYIVEKAIYSTKMAGVIFSEGGGANLRLLKGSSAITLQNYGSDSVFLMWVSTQSGADRGYFRVSNGASNLLYSFTAQYGNLQADSANIAIHSSKYASPSAGVNLANISAEPSTGLALESLAGFSSLDCRFVSTTTKAISSVGNVQKIRRSLVKGTAAAEIVGTAATLGDVEATQNVFAGGLSVDNTGGTDKEVFEDNLIEGNFAATALVTVKSNITGSVVNSTSQSIVSTIPAIFVDTTDYFLSRIALGQAVDSPLINRSAYFSYTYNAATYKDDFGPYRAFTALVQTVFREAFLLPRFGGNALSEDVENVAALLKSIRGKPDVSNRPQGRLDYLSWQSKSINSEVRRFVSYMEKLTDLTVYLDYDFDGQAPGAITINGAHSAGTFEINIQPLDIPVGTVVSLFGKSQIVTQRYPRAGAATKLVLDDVLGGGLSDAQSVEITYIQGAGEFVYVPNRPRKNLRIFSRKKDAYSGMVYTFVRKAE